MTRLVQVAVANDVAEAEELRLDPCRSEHDAELETAAEEHDPEALDDPPLKILVPELEVDAARDAIEALADEDDADAVD